MPLPIILAIGAAVAAAGGVGAGVHGGVKMKGASNKMKLAKTRNDENVAKFEKANASTTTAMDALGKKELAILDSFGLFANVWEKIHNKPTFGTIMHGDTTISEYTPEELNEVRVGAGILLGGLGGAAVGTAGGFAAAGATTAAVMALGTASTGTAIATLSGVAATNATLAALGGGALAAGGGGIALGTTILGASTLGIGLLIGGVIFSISGKAVSKKADKAYDQMLEVEKIIKEICKYLKDLRSTAKTYTTTINKVNTKYKEWLKELKRTVAEKTDWNEFTPEEKLNAENTALIVGLLYQMCKVKLVLVSEGEEKEADINYVDVENSIAIATSFLESHA